MLSHQASLYVFLKADSRNFFVILTLIRCLEKKDLHPHLTAACFDFILLVLDGNLKTLINLVILY